MKPRVSTRSCQIAMALRPRESPSSMASRCTAQVLADGGGGAVFAAGSTPKSVDQLGDSVPEPLGFSAFAPEWLTSGAAGRPPAIPAPGSALGSHPCVATILRPGEASIAGMPRLGHTNQKLLAAWATNAVQQRQVLAAVRWPVLK